MVESPENPDVESTTVTQNSATVECMDMDPEAQAFYEATQEKRKRFLAQ